MYFKQISKDKNTIVMLSVAKHLAYTLQIHGMGSFAYGSDDGTHRSK